MRGETPWTDVVEVTSHDPSLPPQGYRLVITGRRIEISASSAPGRFYAGETLAQIRSLHPSAAPHLRITDWPDFAIRGVMLDVRRDKVPTMATLRDLIRQLASWKYNHLQLYMEHTFAYRDHAMVWAAADPFTAEEISELSALCSQHHIELAPNQNCLGHMERWLEHRPYRHLAARPNGTNYWGVLGYRHYPPSTLDPRNTEAFGLVAGLLEELLDCFGGRRRVRRTRRACRSLRRGST